MNMSMSFPVDDRRGHPRWDNVFTKIEDVTYAILRNSTPSQTSDSNQVSCEPQSA